MIFGSQPNKLLELELEPAIMSNNILYQQRPENNSKCHIYVL